MVVYAKIEAVMTAVALLFAPILLPLAFTAHWFALCAGAGIVAAAASASAVQLWFRRQAKRSQFRRRQVSSRMATFAEAFSSIAWAGTAALAAAASPLALFTALIALMVLVGTWALAPRAA
jgi:ABC-2 type transport system permease protein